MPERKPRCVHDPVRLFNQPEPKDLAGWLFYGKQAAWVRCAKCGETGYWGGYGARRRVRWGYGHGMPVKAAEWNAWLAERASSPEPS